MGFSDSPPIADSNSPHAFRCRRKFINTYLPQNFT